MPIPEFPSASASPEEKADWVELSALHSPQGVTVRGLMRDFGIGGVIDADADWENGRQMDEDDEICEGQVEDIFNELSGRAIFCSEAYPFEVKSAAIQYKDDGVDSVYAFLALLSKFGKDAGPPGSNGAKLFEEVCAKAAETYLGDNEYTASYVFGFPRRLAPADFKSALDLLCRELGEGSGHRPGRNELPDQKDAKLDVVAWRDFRDKRQGKLIAFGQCATGQNWEEKLSELPDTGKWCGSWMRDFPSVLPIRMFFVPHRIELSRWLKACWDGGILFDRCRIAELTINLPEEIKGKCAEWVNHVLKEKLRG